jgi:hypothetical protein
MRSGVFVPLSDRGYPLKRLGARLGTSASTLQRISAGTCVPTCEVISAILKLVEEILERPMQPAARQNVWVTYFKALRVADSRRYEFYVLVQQRDALQEWLQETRAHESALLVKLSLLRDTVAGKDRELESTGKAAERSRALQEKATTAAEDARRRAAQRVRELELENSRLRAQAQEYLAELEQVRAEASQAQGRLEALQGQMQDRVAQDAALAEAEQAVTDAWTELTTGGVPGPSEPDSPPPDSGAETNRGSQGGPRDGRDEQDFSSVTSVDSAVQIVLGLHRRERYAEASAAARRLGSSYPPKEVASLVRALKESRAAGLDAYAADVLEEPAQRRVEDVVDLTRCLRAANSNRFVRVLVREFAEARSPAALAELGRILQSPYRDDPVWHMWSVAMEHRTVPEISAALGCLLASEAPDGQAVYILLRVSSDRLSDYQRSTMVSGISPRKVRAKVEKVLNQLTRERLTAAGEPGPRS